MVRQLEVHGVDASHHNAVADLDKAVQQGLDWLYHKVSEGATVRDEAYGKRREAARKAGLPFGGYHFARPSRGDADDEARFFLKHLAFIPGDLVPMLDLEDSGKLSPEKLTQWASRWMSIVEREVRCKPVIYTNFDLNPGFELISDQGSYLWMARYNNTNTPPPRPARPWSDIDIFQFSNGVFGNPNRFPGFIGAVDLNNMREGLHVKHLKSAIPGTQPDEPVNGKVATGWFRSTTQNVKALPLMHNVKVEHDILLTGSQSGIVGWQEIGPEEYKVELDELDPKKWETFWGGDNYREKKSVSCPISWRKKYWKLVYGGSWKLNEGVAGISKDRYFTWVVLQHVKTGAMLCVTNKHYVAHAWSRSDHDRKGLRREIWNTSNQLEIEWTEAFMEANPGVAIMGLGDYNSSNKRQLAMGERIGDSLKGRRVKYRVMPGSIDQIWCVNGRDWRWDFDDNEPETLPGRNSDHQGRRSRGRLVAA